MVNQKTIITELSTALGIIAPNRESQCLEYASPPKRILEVGETEWLELIKAWQQQKDIHLFHNSFNHGRYFSKSSRISQMSADFKITWTGPKRTSPDDPPADLVINNKIYISCKNNSKILRNPSPMLLFNTALRDSSASRCDWYSEIAPKEYSDLLRTATSHLGLQDFPECPDELTKGQREILKVKLKRKWPSEISDSVNIFVQSVSQNSAKKLLEAIKTPREKDDFALRLLRIIDTEYFILGTQEKNNLRARVMARSEFKKNFIILEVSVTAAPTGQPRVDWEIKTRDLSGTELPSIKGHIEIRWSHGKFNGVPESKIYLDTPHLSVHGYEAI